VCGVEKKPFLVKNCFREALVITPLLLERDAKVDLKLKSSLSLREESSFL